MNTIIDGEHVILSIFMDKTVQEKLSEWLIAHLEEKKFSYQDVADRAGVSKQVIGKYINQPPDTLDLNVLMGIAHAFDVRPEIFFREIGLFPPAPEIDQIMEEITHALLRASPAEKERILVIVRALTEHPAVNPLPQQNQTSRSKRPARSALKEK